MQMSTVRWEIFSVCSSDELAFLVKAEYFQTKQVLTLHKLSPWSSARRSYTEAN